MATVMMTDKGNNEQTTSGDDEVTQVTGQNEVTKVFGRRTCPNCDYDNQAKNEFCFHCGAALGNVPEIVRRTSLAERTRASWRVYGIETETVGRDPELELLTEQFQQVIEEGKFVAVLLLGPDGIGKSRVIDEFSQIINTAYGDALLVSSAWYEGSEAKYAIIDRLLRSRLYIPHTLPEQEARQRLLEGIRAIVKDPSAVEIAHRIGQLIALPFPDDPYADEESPEAHRIASWRAVVELIRADAESNPLVLVMEDMHFASEQSLDFIAFLAREVEDYPVMYVLSSTEDSFPLHPDPLKQLPHLHSIQLKALADEDVRLLVDQVLQRAGVIPEAIYQRVCTNSLGNPLIAEEILRILIAEGAIDVLGPKWRVHADRIAEVTIPRGLVEVVQVSLDRLTDETRQLLEDAAIVGDVFWMGPLILAHCNLDSEPPDTQFPWKHMDQAEAHIVGLLRNLVEQDLIRQRDDSRYPDELEYTFKHTAVRRLLLEGVDPQRSAQVHGLLAQWYEMNRDRGIPERAATIAYHHEMAGNWERAGYTYLQAAQEARARHHNRQAIGQFGKVLKLLDDSHLMAKIEALHGIGSVYDLVGEYERALTPLYQMLGYAWKAASVSKSGAAHNKLGRAYRSLGELDNAMEHFDQALNLFRRSNDKVGIASTIDDIGLVHSIKGNYSEALEMFTVSLARRRELEDKNSMALSYNHIGAVNLYQGKVKQALINFREGLNLRKQMGDKRGMAQSLNNLGVILAERGSLEDALRLWQESANVATEIGDRSLQCALLSNMGEVTCMLGRLDEAEIHLQQATRLCSAFAERRISFDVTRNKALLELKRGNSPLAKEHALQAMDLAKSLDSRVMEGIALRCIAEVQAHDLLAGETSEKDAEATDTSFRQSIDILEEVGNDVELGRTFYSYGVFLAEQQKPSEARENLEKADKLFSRLGMKHLLEKTQALLSELQ